MIICDCDTSNRSSGVIDLSRKYGDILDIKKFNELPSPVTAKLIGGGEYWIETLCVQTGAMRIDVCGMIDHMEFIDVLELIDINGKQYNPDDFWLD